MVEVPDYLLKRSRERRETLGAGGSGGGPTPAAAAAGTGETGADAEAPASTEGAAAPPAVVEPAAALPEVAPPPPPPELPASRTGIPRWVMPVLVALPFWAIVYMGAFGTVKSGAALTPAQQGAATFAKNCSPCHGARGEGGVGPKLAGGEAALTFPYEADHIAWVESGSAPKKGQPYGDPNRPGGQHIDKSGGMPAFKGQLTDQQIQLVVTYERTGLQ